MQLNTYLTGKLGEVFTRWVFPDAITDNKRSHDLRLPKIFGNFLIEVKTKRRCSEGGFSFLLNRRYWQKRWSLFVFVCLTPDYGLSRIYVIPRPILFNKKSIWFSRFGLTDSYEKFRLI